MMVTFALSSVGVFCSTKQCALRLWADLRAPSQRLGVGLQGVDGARLLPDERRNRVLRDLQHFLSSPGAKSSSLSQVAVTLLAAVAAATAAAMPAEALARPCSSSYRPPAEAAAPAAVGAVGAAPPASRPGAWIATGAAAGA